LLGEEEPELDPLDADHLHLLHDHPAVRTWGFQTDIRPFLAASQVLLFPSYREGFPNVPLQAGSMGCALILSNINGCNEIVQDGENGLLVPPKDTDALADAMFQLRNNEKLREQMAIAIEQKIKTAYDQHKLWQTLLATYKGWLLTKTKRK
jgi:glycosyltransferase involved in cell wall biosynthesis